MAVFVGTCTRAVQSNLDQPCSTTQRLYTATLNFVTKHPTSQQKVTRRKCPSLLYKVAVIPAATACIYLWMQHAAESVQPTQPVHFLSPPSFLSPLTFLSASCTLGSLGSTPGRPAMAWLASTAGVLLGSITSCKPATGAAGHGFDFIV